MILTYHNISFKKQDNITINLLTFIKQMFALRKFDVVHLDEYDMNNEKHIVLRFDDGYKGVVKYALPVLKFFKYPFEIFIVEKFYLKAQSGDNNFINKNDIDKIIKSNGNIQYHSKTHPDLSLIDSDTKLIEEIICPESLKELDKNGFQYFAYPFWKFNQKVLDIVNKNYYGACSGNGFAQKNNKFAMDSIRIDCNTKI